VHTHTREQKLAPGQIVPLEIEIWPSGNKLCHRRNVAADHPGRRHQSLFEEIAPVYFRHEASVNKGRHVLHVGGSYDSHLLYGDPIEIKGNQSAWT